MSENNETGMRIRKIRKELGYTMKAFGELFDPIASKGVVSNWENNYNLPNNNRLKRIAELGGITVDELLYGSIRERVSVILDKYEKENDLSRNGIAREKTIKEFEILENDLISNDDVVKRYTELITNNVIKSDLVEASYSNGKLIETVEFEDETKRYKYEFLVKVNIYDFAMNPIKESISIEYEGATNLFVDISPNEYHYLFYGLNMISNSGSMYDLLDGNQVNEIKKNLLNSVLMNDFLELNLDISEFQELF